MSFTLSPAPFVVASTCAVGPVGSDGCRACVETCPYGAIDVRQRPDGAEIRIDEQLCQRCGACSGVCPTSSIERPFLPPEYLLDLVLAAAEFGDGPIVAITCAASQAKVESAVGAANVVVSPSLLILDETYLLAAIGAGAHGVLLVGCPRCTHDESQILLSPLSVTRAVIDDPRRVAYVEDDASTHLMEAVQRVAELPAPQVGLSATDRQDLRSAAERRARLRILLPMFGEGGTVPMAATGFGSVTVDQEACVACGACAIACPTDTLHLDSSVARLSVTDLDCVGCGACVAACPDDAISLEAVVPVGAAALVPRTLLLDGSVACYSCGDRYAPQRLLDHARSVLVAADLDPEDPRFQLGICPTCRTPNARQAPIDTIVAEEAAGCGCGNTGGCGSADAADPVMGDDVIGAFDRPTAATAGAGCACDPTGSAAGCGRGASADGACGGGESAGGCGCSEVPGDLVGAGGGASHFDRRSFLRGAATVAAIGSALPLLRGVPAAAVEEGPVIVPGRMGMVIDLHRCIGCHACTNVCKAENNVPLGKFRDWVEEHVLGEYPNARPVFLPKLCNHCDDPGCLRACPTGAIFKRVDGIVDLDPDICIACQACMQGCPYGMTFYNHQRGTADKCNLCSHRIDEGLDPACVEVCPSQCRIVGDFDDPDSSVSRYLENRNSDVLREDYGLGPNIRYVGLPGELDR